MVLGTGNVRIYPAQRRREGGIALFLSPSKGRYVLPLAGDEFWSGSVLLASETVKLTPDADSDHA